MKSDIDLSSVRFSVLMAVYINDDPSELQQSLESLWCQTVKASEVVIVEDGPISQALENIISDYRDRLCINSVKLKDNQGLACALRLGILQCKYELVARMDSDDICVSDRFELQLRRFIQSSDLDVLGGYIAEFDSLPENASSLRVVPISHDEIVRAAKLYCPMNHVSVMYKRAAVLSAGSYGDFVGVEDYPLWVSMLKKGCRFENLPLTLVKVRAGGEMIKRRGGIKYALREFRVLRHFYSIGFLKGYEFVLLGAIRLSARLLGAPYRKALYSFTRRKA